MSESQGPPRSPNSRGLSGLPVERTGVEGLFLHTSLRRDGGLCVFIERLSNRYGRGLFRVLYEDAAPAAPERAPEQIAPVDPRQRRLGAFS